MTKQEVTLPPWSSCSEPPWTQNLLRVRVVRVTEGFHWLTIDRLEALMEWFYTFTNLISQLQLIWPSWDSPYAFLHFNSPLPFPPSSDRIMSWVHHCSVLKWRLPETSPRRFLFILKRNTAQLEISAHWSLGAAEAKGQASFGMEVGKKKKGKEDKKEGQETDRQQKPAWLKCKLLKIFAGVLLSTQTTVFPKILRHLGCNSHGITRLSSTKKKLT